MGYANCAELLAPAGSPEAFYGAVKAGADAVYLGSRRFGARAYAENFTGEELAECIRYGHIMGCRLYLTANTLMKEEELGELCDHILPLYECGLDGVIVQDFGVLGLLREHFPGLELHASTQMSLCSSGGAALLKEMGACRIVPARELSLEEIKEIKRKVDIELETFIHGAMCYCYSGQCLFSSILGGRSGNRGRCAQPCRLPYSVELDGKKSREQYFLSMRDMSTLEHLPELIEAGIDSFKIEGRMKKPEYAAGVTAIYRRYMDFYCEMREKYGAAEAGERFRVEKQDSRVLASLYIRSQIQDGYYFRRNGREMLTLDSPAYSGNDEALLADIRRRYLEERKKLSADFHAVFRKGLPASLTAEACGKTVTVSGAPVEQAARQPITEESVKKQLDRLGESPFFAGEITVETDGDAFYPLGQINGLRRDAVSSLEDALLADGAGRRAVSVKPGGNKLWAGNAVLYGREAGEKSEASRGFSVSLSTGAQLAGLLHWLDRNPEYSPACVYLSEELALDGKKPYQGLAGRCRALLIALPYVLREADEACLKKMYFLCGPGQPFSGYLIRSADGLGFLEGREKNGLWHLDASVYTWNRAAAARLGKKIDGFCLPYELKSAEQRYLADSGLCFEKPVYGRIPMMITANCILRTSDRCNQDSAAKTVLIDRYGKRFPVVRSCSHCTNIIYNSVPLSLHRELEKWRKKVRCRLDFTVESEAETKSVLDTFLSGKEPELTEYTTGHERRGVL